MASTLLASTTWTLPFGPRDTGYEADAAYYIQSHGQAKKQQPPDLAIEVVVSHSENKALRGGAFLKIPEIWVLDPPRHRLTFDHLALRGKQKGTYRPEPRSRAFPSLLSVEVLERLDDPETDDTDFHENCRAWSRDGPCRCDPAGQAASALDATASILEGVGSGQSSQTLRPLRNMVR